MSEKEVRVKPRRDCVKDRHFFGIVSALVCETTQQRQHSSAVTAAAGLLTPDAHLVGT